jgi:murein DD-endopeptidase MepM/ murein hydrolase activator NlpD
MPQAESGILAQNLLRLIRSNKVRRWVLAAILPFVGVVAAFGIAPDTVTVPVAVSRVVEELPLVLPSDAATDQNYVREERIQRGDTVASLLARLGVEDADAINYLRTTRETRAFQQLVPGRAVRAEVTSQGRLVTLRYLNGQTLLQVNRDGDRLVVSELRAELEKRLMMKSGEIRSSLFAATDAAGLSDNVAIQLADIFSTDVDFHRDLRKGDRFTVVYETYYDAGEAIRSGRVLSAEFINQGKSFQAVWFEHADGQGGYYTPEGKNIRKAFLRSPLEFSRISSGFTQARFHPVLQTWRAHKGVDYAAPTGTGVKATADGIVDFVGRQGGYGNVVVLRHQTRFTTWYGHLSGFAKGVSRGSRVSQGQIIGYVGMTGLASGPHLHYEFRINDVHQDPLRVAMPPAPPIMPEQQSAFAAVAGPMADRLALLRAVASSRPE